MTGLSKLGRFAEIALVALVLVFVCVGFVEFYAAAGQTFGLFGANSTFYDVYASGQNPWAQAKMPDQTPRYAASARYEARR